jgi:hypothetical protein
VAAVGQTSTLASEPGRDFGNPPAAGRTFSIEDAKAGAMKPVHAALTPIAAGFRR